MTRKQLRQLRPQVMSRRCDTCVFHPDNRMHLGPGRLANIVRTNLARGTALICHITLPYGSNPELGQTVCHGFYVSYGAQVRVIQITERLLGGFQQIDPPDRPAREYRLGAPR